MEAQEILSSTNSIFEQYHYSIVPTVLLPLAFLSTGISVIATFVAGLFGVKLKAEGPRKLLELLLKPKILISAMVLNGVLYLGFMAYEDFDRGPSPVFVQNALNSNLAPTIEIKKTGLPNSQWAINIGEGMFSRGIVIDSELFVGTKDGHLLVIDYKSGEVKEEVYFGSFLSPEPILYKGFLYFGEGLHRSHKMRVYKFDPKKKEIVAIFDTKGHTEIRAVVKEFDNQAILFQSAGGDGLYAIDPISMKKVWNFQGGHMDSFVNVDHDSVYIASGVPDEDLGKARPMAYRIDAKTGKQLWAQELPLSSWYQPILIGDKACYSQGELHQKSMLGGVICFSKDGKRLGNVLIDYPIVNKMIAKGSNIFLNDFYGNLYSIDSDLYKVNWEVAGNKAKYNYSSVQFYNEDILVLVSRDAKMKFINAKDGKVLFEQDVFEDESVFADPLIQDGDILVFGYAGQIVKYPAEFIKSKLSF